MRKIGTFCVSFLLVVAALSTFAQDKLQPSRNKPERIEWFMDAGQGLFIHWSLDSQIGSVISHSLVGASDEYLERYFNELPATFNPKRYDPEEWAILAKLAGFKYAVFTTKHHSGFCMFETQTTDFSIANTPYGCDITAEFVEAFRKQGIAVGFYFSPDDFHFLYERGTQISRRRPGVFVHDNPELLKHDRAQMRELLSNYGPIDVMFIDGPCEGLTEMCWDLQPDMVVTRGVIETPEQTVPGEPIPGPWESCLTMGTQWQFKPTNETYKSGTRGIEILIETRAKGGNLLYNVGPKPDGEIPIEQESILREMALWDFVNGEAVHGVRPWTVTNEGDIWFTKKKDEDTVYAFVTRMDWKHGQEKTFVLKSVQATDETVVSVLGQNDEVLEYNTKVIPKTTWEQTEDGLRVSAYRTQRLYNDRTWPNPVVLKIAHVRSIEK